MYPITRSPCTSRLPDARRRGFSLVELAIVLSLIALALIGIFIFFSIDVKEQEANDTKVEIGDIVQAVHNLYASSPNYANISTAYIASNGNLPSRFIVGSGLVSGSHGAVYVLPFQISIPNDSFGISINGLDKQTCTKIVTTYYGPSFSYFGINGLGGISTLTPTQALSECGAGSYGNQMGLIFH
jgi:prepilin-type N-terminal cleavage/methylation domain-containing protein